MSNNTNSFSKSLLELSAPLLFVFGAWGILSLFFEPWALPSPIETLGKFDKLFTDDFIEHWKFSFFRVMAGAIISFLLGTLLAILAATFKIKKFTESLHTMGQTLPAIIVAIILILLVGTGNAVPILLIVIMTTPFIAVQTMAGLTRPSPLMELVIKSHRGSKKELVRDLYIPQLVPTMRATAILATTMAVKVCILGEFIGSENGIGFLLNVARLFLNMDEVLFYIAVILIQMFFFQIIIDLLFRCFLQKYFYPE